MEGARAALREAEAEVHSRDADYARARAELEDAQSALIEARERVEQYEAEAELSHEARYGA
jgi:uncharacterized membrane protein